MPALDLKAISPCKDAHKGHQPSNSRNWRLRHKIWKKHSKTKPEYSAPSRSLRLSVLYHLITMFPLFWCIFFSWVLGRSPRPSRAKVQAYWTKNQCRDVSRPVSCKWEWWIEYELIFPGLELCFNQMERERAVCLHTSFFLRVFLLLAWLTGWEINAPKDVWCCWWTKYISILPQLMGNITWKSDEYFMNVQVSPVTVSAELAKLNLDASWAKQWTEPECDG